MLADKAVVGLGEILWDVFPEGARVGGAPANFACHAAGLGGQAWMVSAVGQDALGDSAIKALREHRVATEEVARRADCPTGSVQVRVDERGQPRYQFGSDQAWDHLCWTESLAQLAGQTAAVCFGTLGQRSPTSRETIRRFVQTTPEDAWRILDINLRPPYYENEVIEQSLAIANTLKLNEDELGVLTSNYELSGSSVDRLSQLATRCQLRVVALTRGEAGAVLAAGDEVTEHSGVDVAVRDTVGAGDAFAAALAVGLLAGRDLDSINRHASQVAAFVCSQAGATPALPRDLIDR